MIRGTLLTACALCLLCMPATPVRADQLSELTERISEAYRSENKKAALWDLFYTAGGLDPVAYKMLVENVEKLDLLAAPVEILAEPLHPDEEVTERVDGYIYFQNLEPVGAVNIVNVKNKTRVIRQYYGRHNGVLYLTATIKQKDDMRPKSIKSDNWFYRRDRGQKVAPPKIED
jgi:hypothetical protein